MTHVVSCGLILLAIDFSQAGQICKLTNGKMLPNRQVSKLSLTGIIRCMLICLSSRGCKSVNYNQQSFECHLNNWTVVSSSSELNTDPDYDFIDISCFVKSSLFGCLEWECKSVNQDVQSKECHLRNKTVVSPSSMVNTSPDYNFIHITSLNKSNVPWCIGHPPTSNGHFNDVPHESPIGATLPLVCDPGFLAQGKAVCQNSGTWSRPVCVSVSSCSMVKQYQSISEDGEYWLRLTNFGNYTTQIYCHGMSTSSPKEFLTLRNVNYGIYPRIMNSFCVGQGHKLSMTCTGQGGEIWFTKIKVDIATMEVQKEDRTFTKISDNGKHLAYGIAYDCYTPHRQNALKCGTKGRFTIDLRGTGWKVSEDQQWEKFGYQAIKEKIDRQINGTLIRLRCGGFSGGCRPRNGLFLKPNP